MPCNIPDNEVYLVGIYYDRFLIYFKTNCSQIALRKFLKYKTAYQRRFTYCMASYYNDLLTYPLI